MTLVANISALSASNLPFREQDVYLVFPQQDILIMRTASTPPMRVEGDECIPTLAKGRPNLSLTFVHASRLYSGATGEKRILILAVVRTINKSVRNELKKSTWHLE